MENKIMTDIEIRKWCLEKAMAFVSDFRDDMIHGDDYAESYQENITDAANDFYNWITANYDVFAKADKNGVEEFTLESYNQAHEEHMKVHENIMNKLNLPSVEEQPTRKAGAKILSRSISKDCSYRYEDETDEEFKERIERNHELGLENPKTCQPGDRKYNEVGFFVYYGDKNTPDEDVGKGCSLENNMLGVAIDKSQHYYDYDEGGKMTIKAFKPERREMMQWMGEGKLDSTGLPLGYVLKKDHPNVGHLKIPMPRGSGIRQRCIIDFPDQDPQGLEVYYTYGVETSLWIYNTDTISFDVNIINDAYLEIINDLYKKQDTKKPPKPDLGFDPILLARLDEVLGFTKKHINCFKKGRMGALKWEWREERRFTHELKYLGDLLILKSDWYLYDELKEFGEVSVREVREIIDSLGLHFNMKIPNWPPKNIEELRALYKDEIEARLKNE